MPKDDLLRIRCSAADKERFKAAAESAGESLSEFVLLAAKLRAGQQEHGSATRPPKKGIRVEHVPEPLDAQGIQLSDGLSLGKRSFAPSEQSPQKRTFRPDPK